MLMRLFWERHHIPVCRTRSRMFQFPSRFVRGFHPVPGRLALRSLQEAADGAGLQFFISFHQSVSHSTFVPPLKTRELPAAATSQTVQWALEQVRRVSVRTKPPSEAQLGAPHPSGPFSQSGFTWGRAGGAAAMGRATYSWRMARKSP